MTNAAEALTKAIKSEPEWLAAFENGQTFPLTAGEIEILCYGSRIYLEMPTDSGLRRWRINATEYTETEILIKCQRNLGRCRDTIRLIPRTPATELRLNIELGRLRLANELAEMLRKWLSGSQLERVSLNERNGRMAHIYLKTATGENCIAVADVTRTLRAENVLAASLTLFERLSARTRRPITQAFIIAEKRIASRLANLRALLDSRAASAFEILEIADNSGSTELKPLPAKSLMAVLSARPSPMRSPVKIAPSAAARLIIDENPEAIDCVTSQYGETLRFRGLPFARVRYLGERPVIWFGAGNPRTLLDDETSPRFRRLLSDLREFRCPRAANVRHRLFSALPEAWLESILRRNIGLIDANLILSPIYNQFRMASGKIDLLALRRDGRLVIIELKTSPDRETVFQTADYWRRIELQRRRGEISRQQLFGKREIAQRPALVYIVAPALEFHREFDRFARMLAPEIELWRFELHREWRSAVKVIERVSGRAYAA